MSVEEHVWAVVGPTGSGKTALAIELCERHQGEIVSVDSAQVFIGMDLGTAKPSPDEQARATHHLIDVIDPNTQWTAAAFADAAEEAIEDIRRRGRRPILCGGAGLWYRALTRGVFVAPEIDPEIRLRIRQRLEALGSPALHAELAKVDPDAAGRLHPNDRQRIGRALELYEQTGRPISEFQAEHGFAETRLPVRAVALQWERSELYARLDDRAGQMYDAGLIDEVAGLLSAGAQPGGPGMKCIGYREAVDVVRGALEPAEALERTRTATRRYAKRQLNWFRSEDVVQVPREDAIQVAERVLQGETP